MNRSPSDMAADEMFDADARMTAQPSSQAEREVLASIRARICEQGDMHITVSADEMATLRQALGLGWWEDQDERREIDAMALEMLCVAAEKSAAMLAFSDREHATPRSMPEEVVEAYERAAKVCDDAAAKLDAGRTAAGKRINQIDQHVIYVLQGQATTIRALIPGASA